MLRQSNKQSRNRRQSRVAHAGAEARQGISFS